MDLRMYYKKVREVEGTLSGPFAVLVSLETSDGGKAGIMSEVTRPSAAKQIAEGRARLATAEESAEFQGRNQEAKRAADEAAALNRMQVVVVPAKPGARLSRD